MKLRLEAEKAVMIGQSQQTLDLICSLYLPGRLHRKKWPSSSAGLTFSVYQAAILLDLRGRTGDWYLL